MAGRLKKKAESGRRGASEDDYDTDVREILDTGDLELVEQLVTGAGVDVNHCLTSHYSWSLALYAAYRVDHRLLRLEVSSNSGSIFIETYFWATVAYIRAYIRIFSRHTRTLLIN